MLNKILATLGIIILSFILLSSVILSVLGFSEPIIPLGIIGVIFAVASIVGIFFIKRYSFPKIPKKYQVLIDAEYAEIAKMRSELAKDKDQFSNEKEEFYSKVSDEHYSELLEKIQSAESQIEAAEKKLGKTTDNIDKVSRLYKAIQHYITTFRESAFLPEEIRNIERMVEDIAIENLMEPTVEIKLHSYDIKELRKQYRLINKEIDSVLLDYERRYTTKGNLAIYRLMVIALRSELQNVLYTMKYGKFEDAEEEIEEIATKYLLIAADGNKSIAPTITRFVTETKHLFIEAAKVEYEYYLRKERAKEEQKALREQMRQEAEERKKLEEEQRKIEVEESKYTAEMEKLHKQLQTADDTKSEAVFARLAELEMLLSQVTEKKETISRLQNGKAGYVYIISNLGSFGDHTFKIGMTRRLNPQDRIDELGDASVPFKFDVHSFIFSQDASDLETAIHHRLNDRRLNKVNLRKEFFNITLDELEALVYELEPSAEFNRTMAAEQYRQSLSMKEVFSDYEGDSDEDE